MVLEEVIRKMEINPWALTKGAPTLARDWHCSVEDILIAKNLVRKKQTNVEELHETAKVLIFDIETSPLKAWVWNRWKQDVHLEQTISEWFMICWSAKWLGSEYIMYDCLTPEEIFLEDDCRITKTLWELVDAADIIIAHNGAQFDIPKLNSRFIVNGLNPPSAYQVIDTKKVAKSVFGFSSNKLDALAGYFGIETKMDTTFELWKECMEGNQDALDYMSKYNRKDVEILEKVYLKLRPYIRSHPNVANINGECSCTCCGSHNIEMLEDKYYYTGVSKFHLYRCKDCGALMRGRTNVAGKVKVISLAR